MLFYSTHKYSGSTTVLWRDNADEKVVCFWRPSGSRARGLGSHERGNFWKIGSEMQFLCAFFWSIFGFFGWKKNKFSNKKNVFGYDFFAIVWSLLANKIQTWNLKMKILKSPTSLSLFSIANIWAADEIKEAPLHGHRRQASTKLK